MRSSSELGECHRGDRDFEGKLSPTDDLALGAGRRPGAHGPIPCARGTEGSGTQRPMTQPLPVAS